MNWIGVATLAIGLLDVYVERRLRTNLVTKLLLGILIFLAVMLIALFVLHPMLDKLLEPEHEHVNDDARFYQLHRIYLWVSTVQWIACWFWLILIIRGWTKEQTRDSGS